MADREPFVFGRYRGLVWVCDVKGSSTYLNDPRTALDMEKFLPRMLTVAQGIVEAAGGELIKFTGDGFLAWFQVDLHRDMELAAPVVLDAAWKTTFLINVTQLGLEPARKFQVRHGITYEQDGLLMHNAHPKHPVRDLIGRSVIQAFRLSGLPTRYPNIATVGAVVDAVGEDWAGGTFARREFDPEEVVKHFKGERFGTSSVFVTVPSGGRARAEAVDGGDERAREFERRYRRFMASGPEWCRALLRQQVGLLKESL